MKKTILSAVLFATAIGCGSEEKAGPVTAPPPKATTPEPQDSGHGEAHPLGTLKLAGHTLRLTMFGEAEPGVEGAFSVNLEGGSAADLANLNVYLWLEDRAGTQLSAPSKGEIEDGGLHFHAMPRAGAGTPHRAVVRVRAGEADERGGLPLDGHGHEHVGGPHDGVLATWKGADEKMAGHLELKLHDDKGDLELWLARDAAISQPFDLPLASVVEVAFVDAGKKIEMRVRNHDDNADEAGQPTVREGRTNYFVYPSAGEDASWLRGKTFQSIVEVSWNAEGQRFRSEEFMLTPHTHGN